MDYLVDIDGTLADGTHREHHLAGEKKDWKTYQSYAHLDAVHEPIAEIVRVLDACGDTVLLCTGRGEQERDVTNLWLQQHRIPYDEMYMRREGDFRPDDVIKEELLDQILANGYKPVCVIDDRLRVVNMWKRRGIMVLAVNGGKDF